jgi:hypothetical protein
MDERILKAVKAWNREKFDSYHSVNATMQPFSGDYFKKSVVKCRFLLTSILSFYMETGK